MVRSNNGLGQNYKERQKKVLIIEVGDDQTANKLLPFQNVFEINFSTGNINLPVRTEVILGFDLSLRLFFLYKNSFLKCQLIVLRQAIFNLP